MNSSLVLVCKHAKAGAPHLHLTVYESKLKALPHVQAMLRLECSTVQQNQSVVGGAIRRQS